MAPEMAVGEPVDSRADIYALGCVAYYLLTAKLVFEAENVVQVMLKHVTESPVPPSVRSGLAIPGGLETVVLECLAKEPADRPQSALELSQRLTDIRGVSLEQGAGGRVVADRGDACSLDIIEWSFNIRP